MNPAHLHLLVNHLPVIGSIGALIALVISLFWKSEDFQKAALVIALVAGLTAIPAYFSGESAEEVVEDKPGVEEQYIEEHEEAAKIAGIVAVLSGIVAGAGLLLRERRQTITVVATVLFVATAGLMARAGNTGGQIMHPEIRQGSDAGVSESTSRAEDSEKAPVNGEEKSEKGEREEHEE
ncbi:MAG: hypothetical protein KDK25_03035 [Leptospiraceae bacterium]|nr:hypothetical protein [Leptospiraceae bacterium]